MNKIFLLSFLISALLFLLVCWGAVYHVFAAAGVESVSFMVLTYILLYKFDHDAKHVMTITTFVILGRLCFEIPVRMIDFYGSLGSLSVTICCLVGIILGAVSFKEKRISVYVLSVVIVLLFNTLFVAEWTRLITRQY